MTVDTLYPPLVNYYSNIRFYAVQVSFRAESDGLILYNGQDNVGKGDFIAFGLQAGIPEFRFNLGGGVTVIKARKPVKLGRFPRCGTAGMVCKSYRGRNKTRVETYFFFQIFSMWHL